MTGMRAFDEHRGESRASRGGWDEGPLGRPASSLVGMINTILRHRRGIFSLGVAGALAMLLIGLLMPARYTARVAFVPDGGGSALASFAGLAAQLGIPVPTEDAAQSPEFYAELARGREILDQVATATYRVPRSTDASASLLDLYGIEAESEARRREEAYERLRRETRATVERRTGIVRVAVTAPWPGLAAQMASEMLERLTAFDLDSRRTRASAERRFIGERLAESREALRTEEARLERFLEQNRRYRNSAPLVFEHERLERGVALRQQVFTTLAQAHEQAKIEEVRSTPVLSVVERPIEPAAPDSRYLALRAAVGLVLGALIGLVAAFGREFTVRARESDSGEAAEFAELWAEARDEIRAVPARLLRFGRGREVRGTGTRRKGGGSHEIT